MYDRAHLRPLIVKWEEEDKLYDEEGNRIPPPKRDHRSPEFARANAAAIKGLMAGPRMSRGREAGRSRRRSR